MKALGFYLFHLFHNFRRAGGGGGDWVGGGLDSKTVENGGWAGGALVAGRAGVLGLLGGLLGSGGWAGELLRHGVELEALGTGDGSLFHVEGPGTDLEEKTGGTGVKTLAGWFV